MYTEWITTLDSHLTLNTVSARLPGAKQQRWRNGQRRCQLPALSGGDLSATDAIAPANNSIAHLIQGIQSIIQSFESLVDLLLSAGQGWTNFERIGCEASQEHSLLQTFSHDEINGPVTEVAGPHEVSVFFDKRLSPFLVFDQVDDPEHSGARYLSDRLVPGLDGSDKTCFVCSQGECSGIDDSRPERLDLGRTKPSGARSAGCSTR